MRLDPEEAHTLLPRVDPGRVRSGRAVGLRDGAVLALVAAGLTAVEIAALRATAITMANRQVVVAIHRHDISWHLELPDDLGSRLLAWLTEARIWGLPEPVFQGCRGPLTSMGIWKILNRYRDPQSRRQRSFSQASKQPMNLPRRRAA
jgi:site-specific recombinase XerD